MHINKYLGNLGLFLITKNPLTIHIIKQLTDNCESCNSSVLEQLMGNPKTGKDVKLCDRCNTTYKFYKPFFNFIIKKNSGSNLDFFISFSKLNDNYSVPSYSKGLNSILRGIMEYGLRKPMVSGSPLSAVLEISKKCNLDCSYCYINKVEGHDELTTEKWLTIIDKLEEAGVSALSFSGGEPLVRKDLFMLIDYANNKGLSTSLGTNGTMIGQKNAKKLYDAGLKYVEISLFSSNEEKNDLHREKGSFVKAIEAAKYCKEVGLSVGLAITMTNLVKDEVEDFLELAKSLNCDVCSFFNYIPMSKGNDPLEISSIEKEKLISEMLVKRRQYDKYFKEITILQAPEVARLHYAVQNEEKSELKQIGFTKFKKSEYLLDYVGGCFAGRFIVAITSSGDILPCPFFRIKLGNIFTDDISKIWRENQNLALLRDRKNLEENCGSCKYKILCGGCRARAYVESGNVMGADPSCLSS